MAKSKVRKDWTATQDTLDQLGDNLPWFCLVAALIVIVLGVCSPSADVLTQLESRTLTIPSYTAAIESPQDQKFYWAAQRVQRIAEQELGVTVIYTNTMPITGAAGATNRQTREIYIDAKQQWTARFETLTHEVAHLLQPWFEAEDPGEVFVEAVMVVVATHDGDKEVLRRSSRYLADHKASLSVLRNYRHEILRVAAFLE